MSELKRDSTIVAPVVTITTTNHRANMMVEEITNIDPPGMYYYNVSGLPFSSLS